MRQRPGSSRRLLDPVLLPLLSQHHSTAPPSSKRYDNRYEEKFLRDIRPHQLPTRTWGWHENVEVGDTRDLTNLSIDGESTSIAFSERREWLLRSSATPCNGEVHRNLTGGSRASSLTCLSSFSIDDLVVVILLEYDGCPGDDGAQASSEVSEDTTTTMVNVSSGYGIGALRGPGDR
jgi:hypothetical protein